MAAHPPAVLPRAPLRGLRTISYGLYLWHLPVLLAYASWVVVERPAIEAVGRWRPWTRRVPSFPAEMHVKPVPSVA